MRILSHALLACFCLALAPALALHLAPPLYAMLVSRTTASSVLGGDGLTSTHEAQRRAQEREVLSAKMRQKEHVVAQLINDEINFSKAATQLRALSNDRFTRSTCTMLGFQSSNEEENFCRLILYWTDQSMRDFPQDAAPIRERLHRQMCAHLTSHERR